MTIISQSLDLFLIIIPNGSIDFLADISESELLLDIEVSKSL